MTASVAEEVAAYVDRRPYVREALAAGIVNYAALARAVGEDVDGSFEAVKMALRRYAEDLGERRAERERDVGRILEGSSIELKSNVQVCKSGAEVDGAVHARTESGFTTVQRAGEDCPGEVLEEQVLITLQSPETLEDTPGVLGYVMSVLGAHGINVTECISCREDTHLVVDASDATRAFELLNERLQ